MKGLGGVGWFPGDQYSVMYLVKEKQLFAREALLLWKSMILPELGPGTADVNGSEGNNQEGFPLQGSFILVESYFPGSHVHYQNTKGSQHYAKVYPPPHHSVTRTPKIPRRTCNCFWRKGGMTVCLQVA